MDSRNLARIEKLRNAAVKPVLSYEEFYYHFYRRYDQIKEQGTFHERYADAYAYAFDHITPCIDPGELIVGKPVHFLPEENRAEWNMLKQTLADPMCPANGQDSHTALDYALLLEKGMDGVIDKISAYQEKTSDPEKISYYKLCKSVLNTIVRFSERHADAAAALAETCTDPDTRKELENIAAICRKVPKNPASTLQEAIQSVHFLCYCVSFFPLRYFAQQQFQLGRPDRYLLPYYEKDLAEGRITKEDAQVLMDCLAIMINRRVPSGLSSGYMVGGRKADGSIVANDLTLMGMQAIDDIRLVYPSVGLCYTPDMPREFLQKACNVLSHGRSHPAIFNDDLIADGLISYGIPKEDCREYIHSTCVEITPIAASNCWVASPYVNTPQHLLDLLDREYPDFDTLMQAYYAHLDSTIRANYEEQEAMRLTHLDKMIHPLQSCFTNDCLAQGIDNEKGGARYNWVMPSFVGVGNLVDSLEVIRQLVFNQKKLTFAQLKALLDTDFEGQEALRLLMLEKVGKYGNSIDEVDCMYGEITRHIVAECKKYTHSYPNGNVVPSVFCWIMHEHLGRTTGATPDGRKAGFPFGDGSGPCQGREFNGPTASILSSTSWSHKEMIGGVAVNMKFSKKTFTQESCEKVAALITTYMARGGFEIQINVTDKDTLIAAQSNPEQYQDLVVRIGGYSDYFTRLSPQMQAEVILRTEHEI